MQTDIEQIRTLIKANKVDKALELLKGLTNAKPALDIQVDKLICEWKDVRRKEIIGSLNYEKGMECKAELSNAVLGVLTQLKNYIPPAEVFDRRVFISYNHNDKEIANRLKEKLKAQQIDVIIDTEKMLAGQDIKEFIEESIRDSEATISVISNKSLLSSWVAMETINTFYHKKFLKEKKFIACYVEADFFRRSFTDEACERIDIELNDILAAKKKRIDQARDTRDLDNEFTRYNELKNSMDEIVRHLRESLCIDISGNNLDQNFQKIADTIKAV